MIKSTLQWILPDGRTGGPGSDGRPVTVRGFVPGDTVNVQRDGRRCTDVTLQSATPDAVTPSCTLDTICGGCDLARLPIGRQNELQAAMVQHALRTQLPVELTPSPRTTAHRARLQLSIHNGIVGYHSPRSESVFAVPQCEVARPELHPLLNTLVDTCPSDTPTLTRVELRTDGQRAVACFQGSGKPSNEELLWMSQFEHVAHNGRVFRGEPTLTLTVQGLLLRVSPEAFFQVNLEANQLLVSHVVDEAARLQAERLIDLYSGIGNLSFPLARLGPVTAVELEGQSTRDCRYNATQLNLPVKTIGCDVAKLDPSREAFDVAVLDPPRAGAPGVLSRVAQNRPRAILYVSCNIASAARDIRSLKGYRVERVRCFDLFPNTHHIETVITLLRDSRRR